MRARWLGRAGRVVFVLFLGWLLAIVLAGLGLIPAAGIPLAHVLRPSQGPPPLAALPKPRPPSASDLRPALPAAGTTASGKSKPAGTGRSAGAPGHTTTIPATGTSHGKSPTAPGQVKKTSTVPTTHGRSGSAPGQTKTTPATGTSHGKSSTAPGQVKKTSTVPTTHGQSGSAHGHTKTTSTRARPPKKK